MSEVNVIYETTSPRYAVEHFYGNKWRADSGTWEADSGTWEADSGFVDLDDARKYADDQQLIFPDARFRVVDTQP